MYTYALAHSSEESAILNTCVICIHIQVKRVLIGRNGSTVVLTVKQKGAHSAVDVTVMRGCLEWWELHDRVSLTEQQLGETEKSVQEFRQMWMVESKRATSESTQREELSIELEVNGLYSSLKLF